jgi:hypothetical protein
VAADDLPVLIAGDVHGDLERLFDALKPYPADSWRTIFLGDLVDYGPFGVGDFDELAKDAPLQEWLGNRLAMIRLADGTLVQHCGSDTYAKLLESNETEPIDAINKCVRELLANGEEAQLWEMLSGRNSFPTQPERLDRWLEVTSSRRVVFGHNPHLSPRPEVSYGGKAINFDGGFSRFHRKYRRLSPPGATVAPLPPLAD